MQPRIGVIGLVLALVACGAPPTLPPTGDSDGPLHLPAVRTPTPTPELTRTPRPTPTSEPSPTRFSSGPEIIGHSVAGRPLEVYRFGFGPTPRLIVAGIHGGYEWNTIDLAYELMVHLHKNPDLVPSRITLYLLPALNPDGDARSHGRPGRANEDGVDLNRNWPLNWQPDWPKAGCWNFLPINGGTEPASEPEVAALLEFIVEREIDAIISYHSAALGIFPGGQPPGADSIRLAEAIAEVTPYPYPPLNTGCVFTGQFIDWADAQGIAAIDLELETHEGTDFEINLRVLEAFLKWRR